MLSSTGRIVHFSCRCFSASPHRLESSRTHYEVLNVPQDATKNQIKSSYYTLSKKYHPDLNKDPSAKNIYPNLKHSYDILVDDRQRRAYDRSLSRPTVSSTPFSSHRHPTHTHEEFSFGRRKPGATYAWERHRRPQHPHHPRHSSSPYGSEHNNPHFTGDWGYSTWDPNPQRPRPGHKTAKQKEQERERAELDEIKSISHFWRNVMVIGTGIAAYSLTWKAYA